MTAFGVTSVFGNWDITSRYVLTYLLNKGGATARPLGGGRGPFEVSIISMQRPYRHNVKRRKDCGTGPPSPPPGAAAHAN